MRSAFLKERFRRTGSCVRTLEVCLFFALACWVFLTKTAKSQFGPKLEISATFRDKWRSFFNAIWRGVGRLHRGPDGRRKDSR